jgi:DNA-binding transcriptional LysR family regulator
MVNFEWYRTFVAIFEHHTLTRAAQQLFISQPGVSLHLNSLEAYTGKKLFERTARKMIATEEGKQLYNYIVDAVKHLEKAEAHFKKTSQEVIPAINIGMCAETFQTIVEPKLSTLAFNLMARFGSHQNLMNDLHNGILDLVITPITNQPKETLVVYEPFAQENIIMIAGNQTDLSTINNLIHQGKISALERLLKRQIWYSASNDMDHFTRFWHENFGTHPDFKPNYILPNINSAIRCVANNTGFAIVPDFLAKASLMAGTTTLVWQGKVAVTNTLYFVTRTNAQFQEGINQLKDIFKEAMG